MNREFSVLKRLYLFAFLFGLFILGPCLHAATPAARNAVDAGDAGHKHCLHGFATTITNAVYIPYNPCCTTGSEKICCHCGTRVDIPGKCSESCLAAQAAERAKHGPFDPENREAGALGWSTEITPAAPVQGAGGTTDGGTR